MRNYCCGLVCKEQSETRFLGEAVFADWSIRTNPRPVFTHQFHYCCGLIYLDQSETRFLNEAVFAT